MTEQVFVSLFDKGFAVAVAAYLLWFHTKTVAPELRRQTYLLERIDARLGGATPHAPAPPPVVPPPGGLTVP